MSSDDTIQPFNPATDFNLLGNPHLPYSPEERLHRFNQLALAAIEAVELERQEHGFGTLHPQAREKVELNSIADLTEFDKFHEWWQSFTNGSLATPAPTLVNLADRAPAGYTLKEAFYEAGEVLMANAVSAAREEVAETKPATSERREYMREYMRDKRAAERAGETRPRKPAEGPIAEMKARHQEQINAISKEVSDAHARMIELSRQRKEMQAQHKVELDALMASVATS